jgi:hypothetical protein
MVISMTMPISGENSDPTVTYLFSHGIAESGESQIQKGYTKINPPSPNHIIDNEKQALRVFNYPDAGQGAIYPKIATWSDLLKLKEHLKTISYRVDRAHTDFAGAGELKVLNEQHAAIQHDVIVGIGVSRGASALVTWMGTYKDKNNIKALVLESPFDSMDSVLRNILGDTLHSNEIARSVGHGLIRFVFSQYKKRATTPLQAAHDIPQDLPILIVCSEEDTRVPAWSSEKLARELRETGHTNVHILTLNRGLHGKLIQGADGELYRNAVHAFYKRYHLPHNPEWAELGKGLIETDQL